MKIYDSYKDSGIEWIGVIPENWNKTYLKYCMNKIYGGGTPTTSEETYWSENEADIPWVAISDISSCDKELYLTKKKITEEGRKSKNLEIIPKGTLLLSIFASLGKTVRLGIDSTVNQAILGLEPNEKLHPKFLEFLLVDIERYISQFSTSSTQENLNLNKIKNLFFYIPNSIEEQTKIINYLDHKTTQIDHLIAKKEQFIQLLEEERVAVINQAVTKGLDPNVAMNDSGVKWLGEIPEHWEVKKLKQIFNSSKGLTITKENLESEGIPCVNYGEIHSKFGFEVDIDKHQLKCVNPTYLVSDYKSLIQTGDFVFADTSEDVSGAGNFTYLKSNHEIFAGYHTIILRALVDIESRYFAYQFDSIPYRTQIRQSVKGIKVFSITQGILKNTSLWIPPLNEQKQIIDFLDIETNRILSLKNSAVKEIELLKEYKTALISEVVTGKVDVSTGSTQVLETKN